MSWKAWLIAGALVLLILTAVLSGMSGALGVDLNWLLRAWGDALGSIVFWAIVCGGVIALIAAVVLLLGRRRARARRRATPAQIAHIELSTAATAAPPDAVRTVAPDHVPGPRDFVPSLSPPPFDQSDSK